jgi:mannosyl-3-phosphoglycerate phosphatase family protein
VSVISSTQALIFTDLDGSLLDHDSYSFEAASPLLEELETREIPVIPITSKTFAEVQELRITLNNRHPFIVENGAAIAIPNHYFSSLPQGGAEKSGFCIVTNSQPRQHWNNLLEENAQEFKDEFETFTSIVHERGHKGIQDITGLSLYQAKLSNKREYSEPIHWHGSDQRKQAFIEQLTIAGGTLLQGGRFLSLGDKVSKGSTLVQLSKIYQQLNDLQAVHSLAVGDSGNDISMLEVATSAIIIRSKTHLPPTLNRSNNLIISRDYGPQGWAESVSFWLKNFLEIGSKNYG